MKRLWQNIRKWNWVSLVALFIAIMSYYNTSEQYKKSNEQFERNRISADEQFKNNKKSSDSLFRVQLNNERDLNDSIVSEIKKLQSITKDQLLISKETMKEKIFSGRPQITSTAIEIDTTKQYNDKLFTPIITFNMTNVGGRTAYNLNTQVYTIYTDLSDIRYDDKYNALHNLEPSGSITNENKPKIDIKQKSDFFYCYKVSYYDSMMSRTFKLTSYLRYNSMVRTTDKLGQNRFIYCSDLEKKNLREYLNNKMKELKRPPFEE
jgi:hypothetical protein